MIAIVSSGNREEALNHTCKSHRLLMHACASRVSAQEAHIFCKDCLLVLFGFDQLESLLSTKNTRKREHTWSRVDVMPHSATLAQADNGIEAPLPPTEPLAEDSRSIKEYLDAVIGMPHSATLAQTDQGGKEWEFPPKQLAKMVDRPGQAGLFGRGVE
ncbi:hypothetical protein BJ741DRAFT_578030 [Chytriomyces cf. hyalinus JEL632]|nr:hypothetical protein BJ741DRAFT_578030 [Chytriomyces cf. hyalinus JEL632]